ncbi:MAG: helix-turn-helix domain-containing protein [Actinomycetota bacterium]
MAMLPEMLRRDRERWGMSVGEAGWRLGITRREYVALEDGPVAPDSTTYERICEFYGWPDARRIG